MNNSDIFRYSRTTIVLPVGTTVDLPVEGRQALAERVLTAAEKARNKEGRKHLCEKVGMHRSPVVQS